MVVIACALVCGGVGALVGAALLNTENGKKLDDNLYKAFEVFDTRVSKHLPIDKIIGLFLEGK